MNLVIYHMINPSFHSDKMLIYSINDEGVHFECLKSSMDEL